MKQRWHVKSVNPCFIRIVLIFTGIPSRCHMALGCHVSRASFWLWVSSTLLSGILQSVLRLGLVLCFPHVHRSLKGRPHRKNALFIPSYQGYRPWAQLSTGCRLWPSGWGTVGLLRGVTVTRSPALSSLEGSLGAQSVLRVGGVPLPWGARVYADYLGPGCVSSPPSLTQSFIYITTGLDILYVELQYNNCSTLLWELFQLAPVPLCYNLLQWVGFCFVLFLSTSYFLHFVRLRQGPWFPLPETSVRTQELGAHARHFSALAAHCLLGLALRTSWVISGIPHWVLPRQCLCMKAPQLL